METNELLAEIDRKVDEERRNYKGPHCCMTVHYELISGEGVLGYDEQFREYYIKPPKSKKCLRMLYCTDCGQKLPDSLRNKWFEVLKQEYKIEDPLGQDKERIPEKFFTDEWWNPHKTITNYLAIKENKIDKNIKKINSLEGSLHCCDEMDCELLSGTGILSYNAKYREYDIKVPNSSVCSAMDFCPFCGKEMPKSLRDEWFDILEQEYKIEWPASKDAKKVPKEFLTNEWWKKRGL